MNVVIRILVTLISGVATLFFVFWQGSSLILSLHVPFWISSLGSLLVAAGVAWYVWTHTASPPASFLGSVLLGAFVVGGIGFSAGYFGPLLFTPSSPGNLGPMIGVFITGPLGLILGAAGGGVRWYARERPVDKTSNWPKTGDMR